MVFLTSEVFPEMSYQNSFFHQISRCLFVTFVHFESYLRAPMIEGEMINFDSLTVFTLQ
jgi:hypothetical protein